MASSSVDDADGQNVEEEDQEKLNASEIEEYDSKGGGDASELSQKDDSGIAIDSCVSSKYEESDKSPSTSLRDWTLNEDTDNVESLNGSDVPSSSVSHSGAEIKCEDSALNGEQKADNDLNVGDDMMCVDKDDNDQVGAEFESRALAKYSATKEELLATNSVVEESGSHGSKRTTKESDEYPAHKRPTPERWDEEDVDGERASHHSTRGNENGTPQGGPEDLSAHLSSDRGDPEAGDGDDDDDDDDDDEEMRSVTTAREKLARRHRYRRRVFGRRLSSSDELDSSDDNDNNESENSDEDEDKQSYEEVKKAASELLNKDPPKPNWFALPELRKREYGYSHRESTACFRERVQGSLQMVQRLIMVEQMKYHDGCVNALSFNRIGTLLASGSDDLKIVLWNWQRARPALFYESGHRSNVFQAKFMPFSGDCHVLSCGRDGQVRLAELSLTGVCKATRKLAQHRGSAHKLALEYDSANVFLSCGEDAVTFLFDLREERPHKLVTTKENEKKVPLYSVHSDPCDSRQFCVGGKDHYIRVYDKRKIAEDVNEGVLKKFCPDHLVNSDIKANVTCACYNYNGSEILGSYNDEDIYLFDNTHSDGANYCHRYTGHRNNATVKGVNFYGPKSEFIVSGSDCGHVYFWDKETEAIINFQGGDVAGVINVLEPHPTLPILATSGLDHEVKLWTPSQNSPQIDTEVLRKTLIKNSIERSKERMSEPEMIGGQMLWFIMHHFRNSARRRMREEGEVLSTSDDDEEESNSDEDAARNDNQCAQS